jgi:predicted signal transduction protein with EAL and GGDEF domain
VDTVARLGGDEFVVILEDLSESPEEAAAHAKVVAQKILAEVCQTYLLAGRECLSTSSIGITLFGDRTDTIDDVLQQADIAMYQAKAAGRNTLRFFAPELQAAINTRASMEEEMRQAIGGRPVPALLSAPGTVWRADWRGGFVALESPGARLPPACRLHSPG